MNSSYKNDAVAPPKKPRRWFRYSLRTFLIIVTILCIWLGVISNRARKQKLTIEKLEKIANITIFYDYQLAEDVPAPGRFKPIPDSRMKLPTWMTNIIGEDFRRTVWILGIDRKSPDNSLPRIDDLTELRGVDIDNCKIDDEWMQSFEKMSHLRSVHLWGTAVDGSGLKYLVDKPQMKNLNLHATNLCDENVHHITKLKELIDLDIAETIITDRSVEQLTQLKKLETLFIHSTAITDESLKSFAKMKSLKQLNVTHNTKLTWEKLEELRKQMPNCQID